MTATIKPLAKRTQRKLASAGVYVPQAGDLIFVRPGADDWVGNLVAQATGGPYAHVRIRIAADEVIEALPSGIARSFIHPPEPFASDCAAIGATLDADRLAHALAWLVQQVGEPYGFWDIAADAMKALLPKWLGSRTPFLVSPRQMDCSCLATQFCLLAGYRWLPDALALDATRVSPNDLARALSVIK